MRREWRMTMGLALAATLCACEESLVSPDFDPEIPTAWAPSVTNPWFPLRQGARLEYRGETEDGTETIIVEVLPQTKTVNGVVATAVRDRVFLDGELIEDTFDWYAQDTAGNVWYLGEDSKEIEDGQVVSTQGSWEWNVGGALPGIIMWADPGAHLNEEYRQEFLRGEAEDWAKVIAIDERASVPAGSFSNCIQTEDWNGLEGKAETLEIKTYCAGVGVVLEVPPDSPEERVQLINRR